MTLKLEEKKEGEGPFTTTKKKRERKEREERENLMEKMGLSYRILSHRIG